MIREGAIVRYAEGTYEVARVNDNLLVLRGVSTLVDSGFGVCREPCVVLASDVELVEMRDSDDQK